VRMAYEEITMSRLGDFVKGIKYRYPLCCVLRYTFGSGQQAVQRGGMGGDGLNDKQWVACGIFHKGEPYHEAIRRLRGADIQRYSDGRSAAINKFRTGQ
jgi:hypothetical protein